MPTFSLSLNRFATVLVSPPSLDAMSTPTAERKMRHLVNMFSCSLGCRESCLRVIFLSPNFSCSSDLSCSTSSNPSILVTHTPFLETISVLVSQRSKFSCIFVHAGRLKTSVFFIRPGSAHRNSPCSRRSRPCSCVQLHHKHAYSPVNWIPLACARVLDVRSRMPAVF